MGEYTKLEMLAELRHGWYVRLFTCEECKATFMLEGLDDSADGTPRFCPRCGKQDRGV
jgi:hypothetical protein